MGHRSTPPVRSRCGRRRVRRVPPLQRPTPRETHPPTPTLAAYSRAIRARLCHRAVEKHFASVLPTKKNIGGAIDGQDTPPRTLRKSRIANLCLVLVIGAISLPLLASTASAGAARSRTTPPIRKQLAELKGSDTAGGDEFGSSVAISGTTAVVGAQDGGIGAGRAYIFTKTAKGWEQVAELKAPAYGSTGFGYSVAISGTTVVVGAPDAELAAGRAYVFTKTAKGWEQVAELKGSDTVAVDEFGYSVAISGTTAIVGGWAATAQIARPGVRVHQDCERLGAGRGAERFRHRRRR